MRNVDPVEAALAHAMRAIAEAMATAKPEEIVTLAANMSALAKELEARRLAGAANVVPLRPRTAR